METGTSVSSKTALAKAWVTSQSDAEVVWLQPHDLAALAQPGRLQHPLLEAAIRRKIRRLLREHEYKPPVAPPEGGSVQDINHFAPLVLDQAKTLYRYWPDVEGRLFE